MLLEVPGLPTHSSLSPLQSTLTLTFPLYFLGLLNLIKFLFFEYLNVFSDWNSLNVELSEMDG